MSKPVAKDLDQEEALREVIDALRADNGRLLRLLIRGSSTMTDRSTKS
jgi:hypothetical protein